MFFETRVALKDPALAVAWSNDVEAPRLAVSVAGDVMLYNIDGSVNCSFRRPCVISMAWHPEINLLAMGCSTGEIALWSREGGLVSDTQIHQNPVLGVRWSPFGFSLISSDSAGVVGVWRALTTQLTNVRRIAKTGSITHVVFREDAAYDRDVYVTKTPGFYFGGDQGRVWFCDELGSTVEAFGGLGSPITSMFYFKSTDRIVIITQSLHLLQYQWVAERKSYQYQRVKLSAASEMAALLAGPGLIAAVAKEPLVRLYDLLPANGGESKNYTLMLQNLDPTNPDMLDRVAYNSESGVLASAAQSGAVFFWKREYAYENASWDQVIAEPSPRLGGACIDLVWGPGSGLLAAALKDVPAVVILLQHPFLHKICRYNFTAPSAAVSQSVSLSTLAGAASRVPTEPQHATVLQMAPDEIFLQPLDEPPLRLPTRLLRIESLAVGDGGIIALCGSGRTVELHRLHRPSPRDLLEVKLLGQFSKSSSGGGGGGVLASLSLGGGGSLTGSDPNSSAAALIAVANDAVFLADGTRVVIYDFNGKHEGILPLQKDGGGRVAMMTAAGGALAVLTTTNMLMLWDVRGDRAAASRRTVSSVPLPSDGGSMVPAGIAVNCNGTHVAIWASDPVHYTRLYVFSTDTDRFISHSFDPTHYPRAATWDQVDPRLLAAELQPLVRFAPKSASLAALPSSTSSVAAEGSEGHSNESSYAYNQTRYLDGLSDEPIPFERQITALYVTVEYSLAVGDTFDWPPNAGELIGISTPYVFFRARESGQSLTIHRSMRHFFGLERVDGATAAALVQFGYLMAVGNVDEAYKTVQRVNKHSATMWQNIARMCIKTKRIDVAKICFSHMQNAAAVRALRQAETLPEIEARCAMIAIQLGLTNEAAELYTACGRFDLLNQLYQAVGQWDMARDVAAKHDRAHIRATAYQYGKHLEGMHKLVEATDAYQVAHVHRTHVPRMLCRANRIADLERYVRDQNDKELWRWWGDYQESLGHHKEAVAAYFKGDDKFAAVGVLCNSDLQKFEEVQAIVDNGFPLGAYHLGKQFESHGMIEDAVRAYTTAQQWHHVIRLAKQHSMDADLPGLALRAPPRLQQEVAEYFEAQGEHKQAVMLYQRAGCLAQAVGLCFRAELFDSLRSLAEDLGSSASPALLAKCGEFFAEHNQMHKAATFFISAKQYMKALDLIQRHNVPINAEMAQRMVQLPDPDDAADAQKYRDMLLAMAQACERQGDHATAASLFTKAGSRTETLHALMRAGDTTRIVKFASVCRQPDVLALAANYLQSHDWHNDPKLRDAIVTCYSRAKRFDLLGSCFVTGATTQIDDHRNYEKALSYLREAMQAYSKDPKFEAQLPILEKRIALVEKFTRARSLAKTDPNELIRICKELIRANNEEAVRVGDVYALLVELFYSQGDMERAYQVMQRMQEKGLDLADHLQLRVVNAILKALGVEVQIDEVETAEEC
eukprot:gnl/Spiro4/12110_TR6391_c0_g1_i1.p1 gnl/Spiro4/12110_TR6391_c0_g1~~gnl/Spiro4/12110_TR6391_c0_g1_i1.p1  ORF type:complete len:1454 (+),score=330.60 gnl/Spiro4/12110_TR6391_c0_g1_i1:59-4420(+)